MSEQDSRRPLPDQGPRREGPAHRADTPSAGVPAPHQESRPAGGTVDRRGLLRGLVAGGLGGALGWVAGRAGSESSVPASVEQGEKKKVAVREILGTANTDLHEDTLINTQRAKEIGRGGSVTLEEGPDEPLFFYDRDHPTVVTKMAGLPFEEVQAQADQSSADNRASVLGSVSSADDESTTIYQILMPRETDKSMVWVNLRATDTCFVIAQGPDPVDCSLELATDRSFEDMGEGSVFGLTIKGRDEFPAGESVYLMINAKKPQEAVKV